MLHEPQKKTNQNTGQIAQYQGKMVLKCPKNEFLQIIIFFIFQAFFQSMKLSEFLRRSKFTIYQN